ncbi:MAG: tetraacyldisaccharide 4'-kinase [Phycisphaerales bacterium]
MSDAEAATLRPPLPGPLGRLASRVYGWEIGRRNRRYDAGRGVVRFDRPVVSVGNLSVGGTGKSPMVAHLVGLLLAAGRRPCIAMRGYAGRAGRGGGGGRSDEAEEYRARFASVPVVAQADRTLGLITLFSDLEDRDEPQPDCIVLDDGFQHRRIARDLDIVLIDATRSPFEDRLLPAGWLREPVGSLRRAGFVVVTHAEAADAHALTTLERAIAAIRGRGPETVARHHWGGLIVHEGGAEREEPVRWLRGKLVVGACAIGNPGPFLSEARKAAGQPLAAHVVLRDHDPYDQATLDRIDATAERVGAGAILTTEKDWTKIGGAAAGDGLGRWRGRRPVARVQLRMAFDRGEEALRRAVLDAAARVDAEAERG